MDLKATFPYMVYVNLGHREDRRKKVEKRFFELGLAVDRQPGVLKERVKDCWGFQNESRYAPARMWAEFRDDNEIMAWNRFLGQLDLIKCRFEYGETYGPQGTHLDWSNVSKCAVVTFSDFPKEEESSLMRSVYLGLSMGDEMTLMLHLMEY